MTLLGRREGLPFEVLRTSGALTKSLNRCESEVVKRLMPSPKTWGRDHRSLQRQDHSTLIDIDGQTD